MKDNRSLFLIAAGIPSVMFLVSVDPGLGMARDWDLFSLMFLPMVLLILVHVTRQPHGLTGRFVATYTIVCLCLTVIALSPNVWVKDPSPRLRALLEYYGDKDRSGWAILSNYLHDSGKLQEAQAVLDRWYEVFPEERDLHQASDLLEKGRYDAVLTIGRRLLAVDSMRWDFHNIVGAAFSRMGATDSAEAHLKAAVGLSPYIATLHNDLAQLYLNTGRLPEAEREYLLLRRLDNRQTFALEGLGLVYLKTGRLDLASAIADTLFQGNAHSPGGHLLLMTIALNRGDQHLAAQHFAAFKRYGAGRSDYRNILDYYGYLGEEQKGR